MRTRILSILSLALSLAGCGGGTIDPGQLAASASPPSPAAADQNTNPGHSSATTPTGPSLDGGQPQQPQQPDQPQQPQQVPDVDGGAPSQPPSPSVDAGTTPQTPPPATSPDLGSTPQTPPPQNPPPMQPPPTPAPAPSPAPKTLGLACGAGSDCGSGFCVEGVCCDSACNNPGACDHCAVARGAFSDGTCTASAELPRAGVDVSALPAGLRQHVLTDAEDLQQVIDSSGAGVEIIVPATRSFGSITLPARPAGNTTWTVIRTASSSLPALGKRVHKADAPALPKLLSASNTPSLRTAAGASYYWVSGFELAPSQASWSGIRVPLVVLGDGSSSTAAADHIVLDRLYIHGQSGFSAETSTGIEMNGSALAVVHSHIGEIHTLYVAGQCTGGCTEAMGIVGWNGGGPYLVDDNYIASSSHNLFFGGAEAASSAMMSRDITITRNHLHKPWSWYRGQSTPRWQTKTIIEFKAAERVLIDGNYIENAWNSTGTPGAPQIGHAIVMSPRNGDSAAISPWSTVRNVKVRNNKVVNAARGVSIDAMDDRMVTSGQTRCVDVVNNLFDQMPGQTASQDANNDGRFLTVMSEQVGVDHLTVDHNTIFAGSRAVVAGWGGASLSPDSGFAFRNNLVVSKGGIGGDGHNEGSDTFKSYFPGIDFRRNDMVGSDGARYGACSDYANPACSFFSATMSGVQMLPSGESFPLSPTSPDTAQCSHGKAHAIGVYDWTPAGTGRADAARDTSDLDP